MTRFSNLLAEALCRQPSERKTRTPIEHKRHGLIRELANEKKLLDAARRARAEDEMAMQEALNKVDGASGMATSSGSPAHGVDGLVAKRLKNDGEMNDDGNGLGGDTVSVATSSGEVHVSIVAPMGWSVSVISCL